MNVRNSIHARNVFACALVAFTGTLVLSAFPGRAEARGCHAVSRTRLVAVDPTALPRVRGKAAVVECSDGSALIEVKIKAKVSDDTPYITAVTDLQPLLGEWFYMLHNKGEGYLAIGAAAQVQGDTVSIMDGDFNVVATGVLP